MSADSRSTHSTFSNSSPGRLHLALFCSLLILLVSVPAIAGDRIERSFPMALGSQFKLDTNSGAVVVRGTQSAQARIVITATRGDLDNDLDIQFEQVDGGLEVKVARKGSWLRKWRGMGVEFDIELPRQTNVMIDTSGGSIDVSGIDGATHLDTSGGAIKVEDINGRVHADTSGGSISVENVRGNAHLDTSGGSISVRAVEGEVNADTSGGWIELVDIRGGVVADTSGGWIKAIDIAGPIDAETSGGSIEASFAAGYGDGGSLSTSGGRITMTIDPSVGLEIDARASGGQVETDVPLTIQGTQSKYELRGTVAGGGPKLQLYASGGGIRIRSM